MKQADLAAALTIGKTVRVMLKDGRTLQGLLEEATAGGEGEAWCLKFRPIFGSEPKSHRFPRPDDVASVEELIAGK